MKTLQDLIKDKGYKDITGTKPVIEQSFQDGYIANGKEWMRMQNSRNLTSHTYNQETADEIVEKMKMNNYCALLGGICNSLKHTKDGQTKINVCL